MLAVVWAFSHFHHYVYGHKVTVITDHTAVKAILDTFNPSGRHARWWMRVFGQGIKEVSIVHTAGKENVAADALSRSPCGDSPVEGIGQEEVQVAAITSNSRNPLTTLEPIQPHHTLLTELRVEQRKDPSIAAIMDYLEKNQLPSNTKQSHVIAAKAHSYCVVDGIFYLINGKKAKVLID